jgi:hypothetical protein
MSDEKRRSGLMMAMRVSLYLLVGLGFFSSGQLAWKEWTTGEACPVVGSVPACYVAFAGFAAMLTGLLAVANNPAIRLVFYGGVSLAGGLALVGSAMEFMTGNVCPRAGSVPMCYISLAMTVLIGALFWRTTAT